MPSLMYEISIQTAEHSFTIEVTILLGQTDILASTASPSDAGISEPQKKLNYQQSESEMNTNKSIL